MLQHSLANSSLAFWTFKSELKIQDRSAKSEERKDAEIEEFFTRAWHYYRSGE